MKILHISDYFSLKLWYQEVFLAKEEVKNWDNVFVITSNKNYPYPNYENSYQELLWDRNMESWISKKEWIEINKLKTLLEIESSAFIIYTWVLKYIKKIKPDIICCHDLIKPNNIWAYIYKIFFNKNVKIIIDSHEAEYNTKIDSIVKKIYLLLWRLLFMPIIIKYSNKIVATGPNEKAFALKYFFKKNVNIDIIPLWADTDRFKPDNAIRLAMRKKYWISDNEIVFINAWKINESKKNRELLEAFVKISKEIDNLKLFFIWNWDEDYIANMQNIIKNEHLEKKITFIDFVENNQLPNYFNMSDVWVWPWSRSNVFREAASCWLPLILENKEYTRELVSNNGILLSKTNKESIYNAILKFVKEKSLSKLWENSRNIIEANFSRKNINNLFLK